MVDCREPASLGQNRYTHRTPALSLLVTAGHVPRPRCPHAVVVIDGVLCKQSIPLEPQGFAHCAGIKYGKFLRLASRQLGRRRKKLNVDCIPRPPSQSHPAYVPPRSPFYHNPSGPATLHSLPPEVAARQAGRTAALAPPQDTWLVAAVPLPPAPHASFEQLQETGPAVVRAASGYGHGVIGTEGDDGKGRGPGMGPAGRSAGRGHEEEMLLVDVGRKGAVLSVEQARARYRDMLVSSVCWSACRLGLAAPCAVQLRLFSYGTRLFLLRPSFARQTPHAASQPLPPQSPRSRTPYIRSSVRYCTTPRVTRLVTGHSPKLRLSRPR